MIKLSIIIPHYNTPKLLKKLLNSIPQSDEIEVIVIDDNTDKYHKEYNELVNTYDNQNVLFMTKDEQKMKGAGTSRNIGIEMANGKWVLFADSDDFFIKGFYSTIKKYFDTDNDIVFFRPTSLDLITGKVSDRHSIYENVVSDYLKKQNNVSELGLRYRFNVPWSKLYNLKFLNDNNIRFDEIVASNDIMFSTKAGYSMKKYDVSNEVVYCVTMRKGSLTNNVNEVMFDARVSVFVNRFNFLKERLSSDELKELDINGRMLLKLAIRNRYSFKKIYSTNKVFRQNKIPVFQLRIFNPILIVHHSIVHLKRYFKGRRYLTK